MKSTSVQWEEQTQDIVMDSPRLNISGWLEILLLAGLAAVLNTISHYFVEWPALAAIPLAFVALRHGSSSAVLGSLFWLLLCSLLQLFLGLRPEPLAIEHLGPILIALLCGYFSDTWHEKQVAINTARQHDELLLDQITQSHHLLQLSHARLEQRVIGGVDTLRESLQRLHDTLTTNAQQPLPLANQAPELLLQFDSLTWIQSAALHMVGADQRLQLTPAAEIGDPPRADQIDPLVQEAIRQRKMMAVTDLRTSGQPNQPLVSAPIIDNEGRVRAVVCVYKVPFLSFNCENLALMAVLASHLGHMISATERLGSPDIKDNFEQQLRLACDDAAKFSLPSVLVQWTFHPSETGLTTAKYIRDNVRGLDHPLLEFQGDCARLTLLCSLTDRSEFDQMLARIQQLLAVRYAIDLESNVLSFQAHSINGKLGPDELLAKIEWLVHD